MTRPDHGKQAASGRYWPDRRAHRHRKRAHQAFYVLAILVVVAPWFGYRYLRDAIHGEDPTPPSVQNVAPAADPADATGTAMQADGVTDPATVSRYMTAIRAAAATDDQNTMRANVDAMDQASRQAMRLVDPGRAVDREAARAAVQQLPDVRAAGWIDRTRMLVVVARDDLRNEAMIETVCRRLEPVGDTVGVVVSVQGRAATSGRLPRETGRRCRLAPGERIEPQPQSVPQSTATGVDALREQVESNSAPAEDDSSREQRNEEACRILEETTPEM